MSETSATPPPEARSSVVATPAEEHAGFRLDRTIKIGECLTIVTILLSATALYMSLAKDRELRVREQATRVREAAGTTLAKMDRLQLLSLAVFDDLQPLFVDVSQEFGRRQNAVETRDLFWKGVNDVRVKHQHRIRDEQIETGYVALVGFDPRVRALFRTTLKRRSDLEDQMFNALLIEGEQIIFKFENAESYTSAHMGNAFREAAQKARVSYEPEVTTTLDPVQSFLLDILTRTDSTLVTARR